MGEGYRVTATRVGEVWELEVPGVGATRSASARGATGAVRRYLDRCGVPGAQAAPVDLVWRTVPEIDAQIADARGCAAKAARLQARATNIHREAIASLKAEGLTGRDIAAVLGLSETRVSQLSQAPKQRVAGP